MSNKILKIVHVVSIMDYGGIETFLMNLYRSIDRSKIQFEFIVHGDKKGKYDDEIRELGGKIHRVDQYRGNNHFSYCKQFHRIFKTFDDKFIVHGHMRSTASVYLNIAKHYQCYKIIHSHSTTSGSGISGYIKKLYQFPIRYLADFYMACSLEAGMWLFGKKIIQSNNFRLVYNGVIIEKFIKNDIIRKEYREKFNLKNKKVIGHIGRFVKLKNHKFILDLAEKMQKEPDIVFLLIGDGHLKEKIKRDIKEKKINNVLIFDANEDVNNLLQMMDIFILPSLYEGLGIVLIEAQCTGIPCIISENIPKEAILLQNVERIILSDGKEWTRRLVEINENEKIKDTSIIKDKLINYNIKNISTELTLFYLNAIDNLNRKKCEEGN